MNFTAGRGGARRPATHLARCTRHRYESPPATPHGDERETRRHRTVETHGTASPGPIRGRAHESPCGTTSVDRMGQVRGDSTSRRDPHQPAPGWIAAIWKLERTEDDVANVEHDCRRKRRTGLLMGPSNSMQGVDRHGIGVANAPPRALYEKAGNSYEYTSLER